MSRELYVKKRIYLSSVLSQRFLLREQEKFDV